MLQRGKLNGTHRKDAGRPQCLCCTTCYRAWTKLLRDLDCTRIPCPNDSKCVSKKEICRMLFMNRVLLWKHFQSHFVSSRSHVTRLQGNLLVSNASRHQIQTMRQEICKSRPHPPPWSVRRTQTFPPLVVTSKLSPHGSLLRR